MAVITDPKKIKEVLDRSIDKIYPSREHFERALQSGKRLRIYLGADPTSPHLHVGHAAGLLVLSRLQKLGHEVIFLIGDFTARIGDPTDKSAARKQLTVAEVKSNLKNFKKQVRGILNFSGGNAAKVKFNSKWLSKMSFEEVIKLSSNFTVQQMIQRDMFQKRLAFIYTCVHCGDEQYFSRATWGSDGNFISEAKGQDLTVDRICTKCGKTNTFIEANKSIKGPRPIGFHEFLYPLMQGYDSVAMDVDVEIGGTDQTFNMLAGRDLVKALKNKEKFVITTKLLVNPVTGVKMSKTEGEVINLDDVPADMFGKVMANSDEMMIPILEMATEARVEEVEEVRKMKNSNPRDAKARVAHWVVRTYYGEKSADDAEEEFNKVFRSRELPTEMKTFKAPNKNMNVVDLLVAAGLASSKGEARRLVEQGGVKIDEHKILDHAKIIEISAGGHVLQVGKRHFVKVIF